MSMTDHYRTAGCNIQERMDKDYIVLEAANRLGRDSCLMKRESAMIKGFI